MNFTNTAKIFWPKEKYTKGDVIEYYAAIADVLLPHLKDRPMSLNRHPGGILEQSFFQKNVSREKLPPYVKTIDLKAESTGKVVRYLVCNNRNTLLWLANFGCIELNPWASRIKKLDKPDYMTIDLDPHGRSFESVVEVARVLHRLLSLAGVPSYAKTSGKSGLHVVVPLGARYSYEEARSFAGAVVQRVNQLLPDLTTLEARIAKRGDRMYLDIARNAYGQTTAAAYCVRPYPGATVSAPLTWAEVKKGLRPSRFTMFNMVERARRKGDIFRPVLDERTDIRRALARLSS